MLKNKVFNRDDGAGWRADALLMAQGAAIQVKPDARAVIALARDNRRLADGRDTRQRLPAETESRQGLKVLDLAQFAGGVAPEGQIDLFIWYARTIVADAQHLPSAARDFDVYGRRPGIYRVFDEFLGDRRRALDRFPSRDARDNLLRQYVNRHLRSESLANVRTNPSISESAAPAWATLIASLSTATMPD